MKKTLQVLILIVITFLGTLPAAQAQTPGLIFKTAGTGKPVLDPNGDGYVSKTTAGFTSDDISQSEILYKSLPQLSTEPTSDLGPGPDCKFTDMVDLNNQYRAVGFTVDANNNFLFRFRLGGSAPNAKSYSIGIDTDGKFGFTGPNADPNAVAGNPGFEMEITLATNFGVRLYNIDGTVNPNGSGPNGSLVELPYTNYSQKSIALSTNCNDPDVFYDFYMPLSVIQQYFPSFSLTTPIRMVANTIIAPQSLTQTTSISDLGGIDDAVYGMNYDLAFNDGIVQFPPTQPIAIQYSSNTAIANRSQTPVVNSPLLAGATSVSGTSSEITGSIITVYRMPSGSTAASIGTTTVQSGGTWILSGLATTLLTAGDLVKATVQNTANGEVTSDYSNSVQVVGAAPVACATTVPKTAAFCASASGIYDALGTTYAGATIYLRYPDGSLVSISGAKDATANTFIIPTTTTDGGYYFTTKGGSQTGSTVCSNGQQNLAGSFYIGIKLSGSTCEAAGAVFNIGTVVTATPTITTPTPVTTAATSITGTATTAAGATVFLYIDGIQSSYAPVKTTTGGSFTFTGLTLTAGQTVTVRAMVNGTSSLSAASNAVRVVENRTVAPPVERGPLVAGASAVSGTSSEATGSTITVYQGNTAIGTTPVQSNGTWSLTGLAPSVLTAGSSITSRVQVTGYPLSASSNSLTVQAATTVTPTITGSYNEGNIVVAGTLSSAAPTNSTLTLYEDEYAIGTVVLTTGSTSWTITLTNLSPAAPALYAGGILTATVTESGKTPGPFSTSVIVGCTTLTANNAVTVDRNPVCENDIVTVTIANSQEGLIYTLRNEANGQALGTSRTGTGGTITIPTLPLTADVVIRIEAVSLGAANCTQILTAKPSITVYPLPTNTLPLSASATIVCRNSSTNVIVQNSQMGVRYQLRNNNTNTDAGSPIDGTGGTITMPTGPVTATTTYSVIATDVTHPTNCSRSVNNSITITADCLTIYSSPNAYNEDVVKKGKVLATATDADGTITKAVLANGTLLPTNMVLESDGQVLATGAVTPATYSFQVTTTDSGNNSMTQSVTVMVLADIEAVYTVAPAKYPTNGQNLATATDANGAIREAVLAPTSNPMPVGVALNATTGQLYVADSLLATPGTYSMTITTTDSTGGTTTQVVAVTIGNSPLPVALTAFSVVAKGHDAVLTWTTASEKNNDQFTIERSVDGTTFEPVGAVKGHGSTSSAHHYQFTEQKVAWLEHPLLYYRLRQIDVDGVAVLSPVRAVRFNAAAVGAAFQLYPNPASTTVTLDLSTLPASNYTLIVSDLTGRVLQQAQLRGGQLHFLNIQALPAGAYQVTVRGESTRTTKRLLKHN